ncbi:MAG: hypothetical protein F4119_01360 [Acidimicrobiia bacterium]|nr:hypothetical protein [Acidimicrobiia bacterium]
MNTYRCLFSIDVQLVASGCNEGQPADSPVQPTVFHGPPTESEVIKRDHLIAAQESLLNTYRCLFSIDVQLVASGCNGGGQQLSVEFQEGSALRVASFAEMNADSYRLSGPDAGLFEITNSVLRFSVNDVRFLPDFEHPADENSDNRYEVTVSGPEGEQQVRVTVRDRDEPGTVHLSEQQPKVGIPVTARLSDPDRGVKSVSWQWERSVDIETFVHIKGADETVYVPTAADSGHYLRAVASYTDLHSDATMATAATTSISAVIGPQLVSLSASSESFPNNEGLVPAFHPDVLHYKIPCSQTDVVSVTATLPSGTRLNVNGVQPPPRTETGAAITVTETSDIVITLASVDGTFTRYVVHCAPKPLAAIRTRVSTEMPLETLLAITSDQWIAVIDQHGVPRFHRRSEHEDNDIDTEFFSVNVGFFLRSFGTGSTRQWAHATKTDSGLMWQILDAAFAPINRVATAPPLTTTGRHDLRILNDGSLLLMTYEPAVRDFSYLSDRSNNSSSAAAVHFDDPSGQSWSNAVDTSDSAIQILNPDGSARWTWNSWGRIPLEDCTAHRFPEDYAHVNSIEMTPNGVLASFRGCSTVMLINPDTATGAEIVWRIGQTNLEPDHWEQRGLGPAPLRLVGDPLGAFCGQHAASLIRGAPEDRLLLFDNGVACVIDPATGLPLSRPGDEYSRAVEYAIDLVHGEAVFVRDHSLSGKQSALVAVGGHVETLPDGTWLISWSNSARTDDSAQQPSNPSTMPFPDALVSLVDPHTKTEIFSILDAGGNAGPRRLRAVPVNLLALEKPLPPLTATFTDAAPVTLPTHSLDNATTAPQQKAIGIAVAFSRPVKDIKTNTPSIQIEGGTLTAVMPRLEFGKPANSYILAITPHGTERVTVRLLADQPCDQNGICTADNTLLTTVPPPWTNPSE